MIVKLIAFTELQWDGEIVEETGYYRNGNPHSWEGLASDADELAEFAGRGCYRSFHRPNPATAANEDYLAHILEVGHESVLEHGSASFYIEASRSLLAEITRHRHLSFSVTSQRYVDPVPLGYHVPPAVELLDPNGRSFAEGVLNNAWEHACKSYNELLKLYQDAGLPRKQAREAARAVLPNMTNSPMVVSGNHRAWRYVIKNRFNKAADAEIQQLAGELLRQLREVAPNCYSDIPNEPYS